MLLASCFEGTGVDEVWQAIRRLEAPQVEAARRARAEQAVAWMWSEMREHLLDAFRRDEKVAARLEEVEAAVRAGRLSPTTAAHELLAAHGLAGAPEV